MVALVTATPALAADPGSFLARSGLALLEEGRPVGIIHIHDLLRAGVA